MQTSIAKWGGASAAVAGAACLFWFSQRKPPPPTLVALTATPSSSAATASPAKHRELVYDCKPFGVEPAPACAQISAPERDFLEATAIFSARANDCSVGFPAVQRERAERALKALTKPASPKASPWRRALLQNAALRLESCSRAPGSKPDTAARAAKAAAGLAALSLTDEELSALPRAEEQLRPWLGDSGTWLRAEEPRSHLHENGAGTSLSYQALARSGDVANVARAVLLDAQGHVRVSELIVRALFRRTVESAVYVCVAELDPSGEGCGSARALRPVSEQVAARAFQGEGGPGCPSCHLGGVRGSATFARRSGEFGPTSGAQVSSSAQARAERALAPLLGL